MTQRVSDEALMEAARDLGRALRKRRMYPPISPAVGLAVQNAHRSLRAAMAGKTLRLDVLPEALVVLGEQGKPLRLPEQELARRLHLSRIGRIELTPEIEDRDIRILLGLLLEEEDTAALGSRLAEGEIPTIRVQLLDLNYLFESDGNEVGFGDQIWTRILDAFDRDRGSGSPGERKISEPQVVEELLSWVVESDALPDSLHGYSRADLLPLVMEQVATHADEEAETTIASLEGALREVFAKADPETWLEVLSDPLPVEVGTGEKRSTVDLAVIGARALTAEQVQELVRYSVASRPHATPRLYRLFDGVLAVRGDREQITDLLERSMGSSLEQSWLGMFNVLSSEDPTSHCERDYLAALVRPGQDRGVCFDVPKLHQRDDELDSRVIRVRKGRVAASMLSREREADGYRVVLAALEGAIPDILASAQLSLLDEVVSMLDRHRADGDRDPEIRSMARDALDRMKKPDFIDALLEQLGEEGEEHFHALWRVQERLGADCIPRVLNFMEAHPANSSYQSYLHRMLADVPVLPTQLLCERIDDGPGSFARRLIRVLAGTGRDGFLPAYLVGLRHPDPSVRRAAVVALAQIPGHLAELPLLRALADPVLEVRVFALRTLRSLMQVSEEERLERYLRMSNLTGRNTRAVIIAIRAVEALQATHLLPLLEPLTRRPFLFRRRRLGVTAAARRAVSRLRAAADDVGDAPADSLPCHRAA